MNHFVLVLILFYCAATKCGEGFNALFTLRCKVETLLGVSVQHLFAEEERRK